MTHLQRWEASEMERRLRKEEEEKSAGREWEGRVEREEEREKGKRSERKGWLRDSECDAARVRGVAAGVGEVCCSVLQRVPCVAVMSM